MSKQATHMDNVINATLNNGTFVELTVWDSPNMVEVCQQVELISSLGATSRSEVVKHLIINGYDVH